MKLAEQHEVFIKNARRITDQTQLNTMHQNSCNDIHQNLLKQQTSKLDSTTYIKARVHNNHQTSTKQPISKLAEQQGAFIKNCASRHRSNSTMHDASKLTQRHTSNPAQTTNNKARLNNIH